jgi:general stress protein 26
MNEQDSRKDLWLLVREIPVCMLTTRDGDTLRSRPMATAADENRQEFLFLTRASSHKADEIGQRHSVNLSFADPEKDLFISVSGEGRLSEDHAIAHELWNRYAEAYFPEGPDAPDVAILHVVPTQAEYWIGGKPQQVEAAALQSAIATQSMPELGVNEKVQL